MKMKNKSIENLYLIGMMGSWKSTIGCKLADVLKFKFIDTDDAIEEIIDMKVSDIFRKFGESKFREMESAFFIEKSKQNKQIFSTGGGIVLNADNRKILKQSGTTFLLDAYPKTLANRIHNTTKRPLIKTSENLEEQLKYIWDERHQFYIDCADYIIRTDQMEPPQVISEILNILELSNANN